MISLARLCAAYLLIAGLIWTSFTRVESVLKPETLKAIADHLRTPANFTLLNSWAATFMSVADRALQTAGSHPSVRWPNFRRTFMSSAVLVIAASLAVMAIDGSDVLGQAVILVACLITAPAFGYLSVVKTRAVVRQVTRVRNQLGIVALLALDLAGAVAIAIVAALVASIVIAVESSLLDRLAYEVLEREREPSFMYDELHTHPLAAPVSVLVSSLASALILSSWLWLYWITTFVLRLVYALARFRAVLDEWCDLDKSPLTVIALVSIAIFTGAFWIAVAAWL